MSEPVQDILFIDESPDDKDLMDYRLVIGPHTDYEDWAVYRCTDPTHIEEGTMLHVFEKGMIINDDPPYRGLLGQFVQPSDVEEFKEQFDTDLQLIPDRVTDINIPERREWTEEDLKPLLLSLADLNKTQSKSGLLHRIGQKLPI